MKSPTTRPIKPSTGITFIQRKCAGRSASIAGTNMVSQIPPRVFARGDCTFIERNQRAPSRAGKITSRKAPTPKNCNSASAVYAPTTPIQLRAACAPVRTEALFHEGSRGEYETRARKRRSAETHSRKPISSLSRRLPVGTKTVVKKSIGRRHQDPSTSRCRNRPEPLHYDKGTEFRQCRKWNDVYSSGFL